MTPMKLAVWSPLPPSPSGIADYVAETLPLLLRHADVEVVVDDPADVDPAVIQGVRCRRPTDAFNVDLHLYHVGNSPSHAFIYRQALKEPGIVFLHDFCLHHLVLRETVERGDISTYLREMRRGDGERGTFVAQQVARGLGGTLLPALFPLNDRLLERQLGIVGLSNDICSRVARRLPGRPVLHLPHHIALPLTPLPSQTEARMSLQLSEKAPLIVVPGLATFSKELDVVLRVMAHLRSSFPTLRLVVAGELDRELPLESWARELHLWEAVTVTGRLALPHFIRHLVAADIVVALRFPSHGEMSGALVRALGVGRPVLVTAGTPAAQEFPEGIVLPVDPGPYEEAELEAFLHQLLKNRRLRESIGEQARDYVYRYHDLASTVDKLLEFLETVLSNKEAIQKAVSTDYSVEEGLLGYFMEEVRWGARDLGLTGAALGVRPLLAGLVGVDS